MAGDPGAAGGLRARWHRLPSLCSGGARGRPLPLPLPSSAEPRVVLWLDAGHPDRVIFHGQAVPLRPAEFRLLSALAAEPGRCLSYDHLYNVLWGPDEIVEPAQIHWHRSKLARRLRQVLPEGAPLPLRTVPRQGFLLDLRPEEVERS